MSILHTVNKSPFEKISLDSCVSHVREGSAVLLYEDGVYAALKGTGAAEKLAAIMGNAKVYMLGPDIKARGLSADKLLEGVEVVDYAGFVDLAAEYDKVLAWV
jgi:tRNA 2-thiouridine synthesizing protein B